jgi:protein TonB
VKRLLPAIICALALHAIILSTGFSWLKLASRPAPASRSLSITLSADKLQKRDTRPAVANSAPENRFQPGLQQKPKEKPAGIPAAARLDRSARIQKRSPADTQKKVRPKRNLKALTRKTEPVKKREATRLASIDKSRSSAEPRAWNIRHLRSAQTPYRNLEPAEAVSTRTRRAAHEHSASTPTAAVRPTRQNNTGVTATARIMAKPLYRQNPAPAYPRKARRMGYEGTVMLKVLVDENGRVRDLMVLESSGYSILDRTALASVRKWLFEPGTEGGIKKKMWVKVPIRFDLR